MDQYIEFASNHWMLVTAFLAVTYFLIEDIVKESLRKYQVISPMLTVSKLNSDTPTIVLDVRGLDEFKKGHIADAIHITLSNIDKHIKKIELYKQDDLIVVCQTGMRSAAASEKLTKLNFKKVFLMTGGMQSWEENKLPIVKDK